MYPLITNRHSRPVFPILILALILLATPRASTATEPIGKVIRAVQSVAINKGQVRYGDNIFLDDEFAVGRHGTLTLLFNDESTLILAPESRARITPLDQNSPNGKRPPFFIVQLHGSYRWMAQAPFSQGRIEYVDNLSVFTPPGNEIRVVKPAAPHETPPKERSVLTEDVTASEGHDAAASSEPDTTPVMPQEKPSPDIKHQATVSAQAKPAPPAVPSSPSTPQKLPKKAVKRPSKPANKPATVKTPQPQNSPTTAQADKKPQAVPEQKPVIRTSKPPAEDKTAPQTAVAKPSTPRAQEPAGQPISTTPRTTEDKTTSTPSEPSHAEPALPAKPEPEAAETPTTSAHENPSPLTDDASPSSDTRHDTTVSTTGSAKPVTRATPAATEQPATPDE